MRLSQKMVITIALLILFSNLTVLILVTFIMSNSIKKQALEELNGQLEIAISATCSSIEDIGNLMCNISAVSDVKIFAENSTNNSEIYLNSVNNIYSSLQLLLRSNNMVDYASLVPINDDNYIYIGETIPCYDLPDKFFEKYNKAKPFSVSGVSAGLFQNIYDCDKFNLYCPVYERYAPVKSKPIALLVVGFDIERIAEFLSAERNNIDIRLLDMSGQIIVSSNAKQIGEFVNLNNYKDEYGFFSSGNIINAYMYDKNNYWITDGSVSQNILFDSTFKMILIIVVIIVLCTFFAISISIFFCKRIYAPMQEIVTNMKRVSSGNINTKMKHYQESDFDMLSEGFNTMTDSIKALIKEVKQKELEMTDIRLKALQSQIKPHFLYNTLECIHWQAEVNQNTEISKMVMALSKYYRLCLSKGQDMVSLSQEIEHTQSYVTIQNMRFDDIVKLHIDINENIKNIEIPKITLQPIVENSIYHGIKPKEDVTGNIWIKSEILDNKDIVLYIEDDGIGMSYDELEHLNQTINIVINDGSYGVKNVNQRICMRFGQNYGLKYFKNSYGGISVKIRLPAPSEEKE